MAAKDMVVCARWSPVVIAAPGAEGGGDGGGGPVAETPGRSRTVPPEGLGAVRGSG